MPHFKPIANVELEQGEDVAALGAGELPGRFGVRDRDSWGLDPAFGFGPGLAWGWERAVFFGWGFEPAGMVQPTCGGFEMIRYTAETSTHCGRRC